MYTSIDHCDHRQEAKMNNQITTEDVKDIQQLLRFDEKTPLKKMVEILGRIRELVIEINYKKNDKTRIGMLRVDFGIRKNLARKLANICVEKVFKSAIQLQPQRSQGGITKLQMEFVGHPILVELAGDCYFAVRRVIDWNSQASIKNITLHKRSLEYCDAFSYNAYVLYMYLFDRINLQYGGKYWGKIEDVEPCLELINNINIDRINKKLINQLIRINKYNNCGDIVSVDPEKYGFISCQPYHSSLLKFCTTLFNCELTEHGYLNGHQKKIDAAMMICQTLCKFVDRETNRFLSILIKKLGGKRALDTENTEAIEILEFTLQKHIANLVIVKLDSALRFKGMK